MSSPALFTPLTLGGIELPNRILMAPLTRCRADADHVPTDLMVEYYTQRASAGLIIAEATMVMEGNSAFAGREPGIYSDAQIVAWRKVTDAVHAQGGRIFLQLWHGGRACHPYFNDGATPVSASPLPITNDEAHTPEGKKPYATPRELADDELPAIVEGFRKAALNAKVAGFDGVEIHGANGYLLDQFLRDGSNKRGGEYGGPVESRARLLLEVVDAAISVWGIGLVGVRLSPLNSYNSMEDSDPAGLTAYVATQLQQRGIAYLHLMRADFFGVQQGDMVSIARDCFKGSLIGNMGYTPEEAEQAVAEGILDGVAFGHHYISNPDLVERIQAGVTLVEPDASTFYTQEARGYTDYPPLAAA
ncbi:alkene reductase [Prosthecobacter sp. SYSU 5D2]|uniref:alkene reductase n=1 Tax=Prosthecobacter sp. SYSU 5D2 TaxID=3134134 RepID=UPI0031FF1562